MFGGTLWSGSIGASDDHSIKERDPPARPIPLEFPSYIPPFAPKKLDLDLSNQVRHKLCHLRTFNDISNEDLSSFNVHFAENVGLSELVPHKDFQSRPLPFDEDLESMIAEISVNNRDAFREILRMDPLPGNARPRLAYARNFFGSLEDMARYFDNSNDQYYSIPCTKPSASPAKSTATPKPEGVDTDMTDADSNQLSNGSTASDETDPSSSKTKEVYRGYRFGNAEQVNHGSRVALVKNLMKMVMHKFMCRDHEPMPAPREKFLFRGVKIQSIQYHFCVARIPKDSKLARARMVEGPLMAAHVREEVHFRSATKLVVQDAKSAPQGRDDASATAGKSPTATAPRSPVSVPGSVSERFDFFREIGCMLILAMQRERESKTKDSLSGADKWWVKAPRWGGGPTRWGQLASEIFEDEDPSLGPEERRLRDQKQQREQEEKLKGNSAAELLNTNSFGVDDLMANNAPVVPAAPGDPLGGPRRKKLRSFDRPAGKEQETRDGRLVVYMPPFKKKWYQDWQKLRPNTPMWDDRVLYSHIGKEENSEFDAVFMVTCVNHHMALLKMRVHPDYIAWIDTGKEVTNEETSEGLKRNILYVQRSVWYDMLDVTARQDFLVALWTVMSWINREHIDQAEHEKAKDSRTLMIVNFNTIPIPYLVRSLFLDSLASQYKWPEA